MNKADFISKLAVEMNISQQQSRQFMKAFQVVLTEAMKQDSPVMLQGFGTFTPWSQKDAAFSTSFQLCPFQCIVLDHDVAQVFIVSTAFLVAHVVACTTVRISSRVYIRAIVWK